MKKTSILKLTLGFSLFCTTACTSTTNKNIQDGTYIGSGEGYKGEVKVEAVFSNGMITSLNVVEENETETWSDAAIQNVPKYIQDTQSINVDTQSGATITSQAIIDATKDAIEQAHGNVAEWNDKHTGENETKVIEKQTQVVVIGGGLSGIIATLRLQQLGVDCILLEKSSVLGGILRYGESYSQIYSTEEESNIYKISNLFQENEMDDAIVSIMENNLEDTVAWQEDDLGIVFEDIPQEDYLKYYASANTNVGELLAKEAEVSGAEIYLNTIATNIDTDAKRVSAIDKTGKIYEISAENIIIATGSFSTSDDLYAGYASDTGEMFEIGKLNHFDVIEGKDEVYTSIALKANEDYAVDCFDALQTIMNEGFVIVDENGNRYVNEASTRQTLYQQVKDNSYLIMNTYVYKQWKERLLESVTDKTIQQAIKEDLFMMYHGDTLQIACENANLDYETVIEDLYAIVTATTDQEADAFGRLHADVIDPSDAIVIIPLSKAAYATKNGFTLDENLNAVKNDMVLDGVFVVGNACGDVFGDSILDGYMNAWAVVSAKEVADQIAQQYVTQ